MVKSLAERRKEKGLTQNELAQRIGVSQRAVAAYELGERHPSVGVLRRIMKEFDLELSEAWAMVYGEE